MNVQYFLPRSPEAGQALQTTHVPFVDRFFGETKGYAFDSEYRNPVVKALGWERSYMVPTHEASTMMLQRSYTHPRCFIEYPPWTNYACQLYCRYAENWYTSFAEKLSGFPVAIHLGWDSNWSLLPIGRLHICLGSGGASYKNTALEQGRTIKHQYGHLWIGELAPWKSQSCEILKQLLHHFGSQLIGDQSTMSSETAQQMRRISRKPFVESAKFERGCLIIQTTRRSVRNRRGRFDFGQLEIIISNCIAKNSRSEIEVRNLTYPSSQHPFSSKGWENICYGNYGQRLRAHLDRGEYAAVIEALWYFFSSDSRNSTYLAKLFPRYVTF